MWWIRTIFWVFHPIVWYKFSFFWCILLHLMNKPYVNNCSRWIYLRTENYGQTLTMRTQRFSSIHQSLECLTVTSWECPLRTLVYQFLLLTVLRIKCDLWGQLFQLGKCPFCFSFARSFVLWGRQWLRDCHRRLHSAIECFGSSRFGQFCSPIR